MANQALEDIRQFLRAMLVLLLSAAVFPFAAAVCLPCFFFTSAVSLLTRKKKSGSPFSPTEPSTFSGGLSGAKWGKRKTTGAFNKCVLILAGAKSKALYLGRLFKAEGYEVVLVETVLYPYAAASFSRKVDKFHYLPDPKTNPGKYVSDVLDIVKTHNPFLFVPMDPRTVSLDTEVMSRLPKSCFPLNFEAEVFTELDNKDKFMAALKQAGIPVPVTYHVTCKQEAYDILKGRSGDYVMKPVLYDNVRRGDINPPEDLQELDRYLDRSGVSEAFPYVIQEKLMGPELSSCSLVLGGEILARNISSSSPVHQTFDALECRDISDWLDDFVRLYPRKLTGFLTVDFMKSAKDGRYLPIECNPRFGSYFMLFDNSQGVVRKIEEVVTGLQEYRTDHAELDTEPNTEPNDPRNPRDPVFSGRKKEEDEDPVRKPGKKAEAKPCSSDSERKSTVRKSQPLTPNMKQNFWLMNVLLVLLTNPFNIPIWRKYVMIFVRGREAVFDVTDPLPFMALNFLQMPALVVRNLFGGQPWNVADYCIGTLKWM